MMKTLLLIPLIALQVEATCLKDYMISQKKELNGLSKAEIEKITTLASAHKPIAGWKALADLSDPYAALAYKVISKSDNSTDQYYQTLIKRHWTNIIGEEAVKKNFESVAAQHFSQYAKIVESGYWPDSDQILNSYLKAVRDHGLPDETVFDAAWDASGMNSVRTWQSLNHLDETRAIVPTNACFKINSGHALKTVMKDLSGL